MDKLFSTAEVADRLGVIPRRVRALATSRGLGKLVGRVLVFTQADIDAMRDRNPGRPYPPRPGKRPSTGLSRPKTRPKK